MNADGKLSNDRALPVQVRRQLRVLEGRIDGPEPRAVDTLLLGPAVERLRVFAGVSELGVLPRAERIGRPRTEGLGNGPAGTLPNQAVGPKRLVLQADIFNLFNRQAITVLDERYNLIEDGECAGLAGNLCNGDGGIATTGTA